MPLFPPPTINECFMVCCILINLSCQILANSLISTFVEKTALQSLLSCLLIILVLVLHRQELRRQQEKERSHRATLRRVNQAAIHEVRVLRYDARELDAENMRLRRTIRGQQSRWEGVQMEEENFIAL